MVGLPRGCTADEFTEKMACRGIIIRNLKNLLGLPGEYVRVTVGNEEENRKFLQACTMILNKNAYVSTK